MRCVFALAAFVLLMVFVLIARLFDQHDFPPRQQVGGQIDDMIAKLGPEHERLPDDWHFQAQALTQDKMPLPHLATSYLGMPVDDQDARTAREQSTWRRWRGPNRIIDVQSDANGLVFEIITWERKSLARKLRE